MRQVMKEENIIHVEERIQSIEAKAKLLSDKDLKVTKKMWKEWITCVNRWEI